jgi:hypothetical protein
MHRNAIRQLEGAVQMRGYLSGTKVHQFVQLCKLQRVLIHPEDLLKPRRELELLVREPEEFLLRLVARVQLVHPNGGEMIIWI